VKWLELKLTIARREECGQSCATMNKLYRIVLLGVKDDHRRLYSAHIIRKVQELKRGMIHFVDPEVKLLQSFLIKFNSVL